MKGKMEVWMKSCIKVCGEIKWGFNLGAPITRRIDSLALELASLSTSEHCLHTSLTNPLMDQHFSAKELMVWISVN